MKEMQSGSGNGGSGRGKRLLVVLLAFFLSVSILEFGGFLIWRAAVSPVAKANAQALCSSGDDQIQMLPNTFWHHEFNPRHPSYAGQVNSKGTKGVEFLLPKPPGELRIVCVGDSTVEGTGVKPDETFPHYLEMILQKRLNPNSGYKSVKVINAGIGSHNSAFNLSYLAFRLIHYQPDIVVVKSAYNDYLPYSVPGMSYDYTHVFPNPYHRVRPSAFWTAARYSYFLKVVGTVVFREEVAVPFRDFSGHITLEQFRKMDYSANEDRFFVYGENIRSMILLCRGRNIGVVLVDLPTSPDPAHFGKDRTFGPRFKNLITRLETELRRIAGEERITVVRTGPFTSEDFWDHCHCTAGGNRKVAEAVAGEVADSLTANRKGKAAADGKQASTEAGTTLR
ncbi:MAG: hypothetical protein HPY65_15340 [Syntrophaceae bacterium]|nr:hypothetical protein [Syntrophaceae bacterium]